MFVQGYIAEGFSKLTRVNEFRSFRDPFEPLPALRCGQRQASRVCSGFLRKQNSRPHHNPHEVQLNLSRERSANAGFMSTTRSGLRSTYMIPWNKSLRKTRGPPQRPPFEIFRQFGWLSSSQKGFEGLFGASWERPCSPYHRKIFSVGNLRHC